MNSYLFTEPSYLSPIAADLLDDTIQLAQFASKNLKQLHATIVTADDARERDEALAKMCLASAALNLLSLAYFSESSRVVDEVKTLLREIQR